MYFIQRLLRVYGTWLLSIPIAPCPLLLSWHFILDVSLTSLSLAIQGRSRAFPRRVSDRAFVSVTIDNGHLDDSCTDATNAAVVLQRLS